MLRLTSGYRNSSFHPTAPMATTLQKWIGGGGGGGGNFTSRTTCWSTVSVSISNSNTTFSTNNNNNNMQEQLLRRSYVSRAHPQRLPEYPVTSALQMVLDETQQRYEQRAAKWERNQPTRIQKGIQVSEWFIVCLFVCFKQNKKKNMNHIHLFLHIFFFFFCVYVCLSHTNNSTILLYEKKTKTGKGSLSYYE